MIGERARNWGVTAAERRLELECDRLLSNPDDVMHRAVGVDAPAAMAFRWLCQLRVAPYSYDWIDNRGRRSPRELTPGLDRLEVGQRVMTIFRLAEFEPDRHLTLAMVGRATRVFGDVAGTYLVVPAGTERCRLVVRLLVVYPRGATGALTRRLLPPGDLVMMRKQLLTLKRLAERDASLAAARSGD